MPKPKVPMRNLHTQPVTQPIPVGFALEITHSLNTTNLAFAGLSSVGDWERGWRFVCGSIACEASPHAMGLLRLKRFWP